MLDIGDVVLDFGEGGQGLSGDGVAKIFFDLHGDLNGVQWVEAVFWKGAILGHTCVEQSVPFL